MLQATLNRLEGLSTSPPIVLCNEEHRFLTAEQLRQTGRSPAQIILEPAGRNTAPAITVAALHALSSDEDATLVVLSADHEIHHIEAFQDSIRKAINLARLDKIVVFGVRPTHPETGYGYIQTGEEVGDSYLVKSFKEKPNHQLATKYMHDGSYYWNCGIFVFKARTYLNELEKFRPDIMGHCNTAYRNMQRDLDFVRIDKSAFFDCPAESIDYALLESTSEACMVAMEADWSDVGSWSSLWESQQKNADGNVITGDVITERTHNSYIHAENRLVATAGIDNLIVVETNDTVLVAEKNQSGLIKNLVDQLKKYGRSEHLSHPVVHRPWGSYYAIYQQERYQVKHITVKPGAKLSTQMHHHRAEHWVIVKGIAQVTKGEQSFLLSENESTFIPVGVVHALENPGIIPLELIEVQSGPYLGEDDIVRYEDKYGRI